MFNEWGQTGSCIDSWRCRSLLSCRRAPLIAIVPVFCSRPASCSPMRSPSLAAVLDRPVGHARRSKQRCTRYISWFRSCLFSSPRLGDSISYRWVCFLHFRVVLLRLVSLACFPWFRRDGDQKSSVVERRLWTKMLKLHTNWMSVICLNVDVPVSGELPTFIRACLACIAYSSFAACAS